MKMKEYEEPKMNVIAFGAGEVITTSDEKGVQWDEKWKPDNPWG